MTEKVIVFARNPVEGRVKTRLANHVGAKKALDIYNWLLQLTLSSLRNLKSEVRVYFDQQPVNYITPYAICLQDGHNLGDKMEQAFAKEFAQGERQKIIIIGSDCPDMSKAIILQAFEEMENNDIVVGPALDGGFYLIGMKKTHPGIFNNIAWSTSSVNEQLMRNCHELGLQVRLLTVLRDVDELADFELFEVQFKSWLNLQENAIKK